MDKRKLVLILLGVVCLLALVAVLVGGNVIYTLWRHEVFVPPTYDETTPALGDLTSAVNVLVFSKTNSFRHVDAIPVANAMFRSLGEAEGWSVTFTENSAVHNAAQLEAFDLIVWNNVSGDVLTLDQRAAFRSWIEGGGPVLAIHATGGDPVYQWDWHPAAFIRAQFIGHPLLPQFQEAVVKVENRDHPAMTHLPANWTFKDEWYSFKTSPREKVHVLASLDEATYNPALAGFFGSLRMGDHPIIWYHEVGEGTVFYSALGHRAESYADADYRRLLVEAARWLLSER